MSISKVKRLIHINLNFTIDWGLLLLLLLMSLLDCGRCQFGAEDASTGDDVVWLARLTRSWPYKLFHCCTARNQTLLLLSRRRSLIDLVMLNVKLVSNRLNYQALLRYLRGRTRSAASQHDIVGTLRSYWILNECDSVLVVVVIAIVQLLLLVVGVGRWMDLISVQYMLGIVKYGAASREDI